MEQRHNPDSGLHAAQSLQARQDADMYPAYECAMTERIAVDPGPGTGRETRVLNSVRADFAL